MSVLLKESDALKSVRGIRLASGSADLYKNDRDDIVLIELEQGSSAAAVFTRNAFSAAPVKVAQTHLNKSSPRYCLINAGNANAGTGDRGYEDALSSCQALALLTGCQPEQVLPFSTGVIGEYLPMENIKGAFVGLISSLEENNWLAGARAIMTTDTVAKGVSKTLILDNEAIQITGIAKGSGMIRPDMATMLAFIATDASIDTELLKQILAKSVDVSFNRICVDGDTSTNDACLLIATGKSKVIIKDAADPLVDRLQDAIDDVCIKLAQAIVRDGEGATKFVSVNVQGGVSGAQCLDIAYMIANSPLVKTALFASDPNWGRIIAAIGNSRTGQIEPGSTDIFLNDLCIVSQGEKAKSYTEAAGQVEMSKEEIVIRVELGMGGFSETVWTCDLSHEYVRINAEYRS